MALNAVKRGKHVGAFQTAILPPALHADLAARLAGCTSREDVRAVFAGYLASPTAQTPPAPLQRDTAASGDVGAVGAVGEPVAESAPSTVDALVQQLTGQLTGQLADQLRSAALTELRSMRADVLAALA